MKPKRAVEIHDRKKYGLQTPIGFLTLEYCPLGLHAIHHEGQEEGLTQQENNNEEDPKGFAHPAVTWLHAYFGDKAQVDRSVVRDPEKYPPICWDGMTYLSDFAREVLQGALQKIPYGRTVSYGELARMIGHEGASRAVGTVMKNNPVPVLIPCHRVVKADGSLGNYSGGNRNHIKGWLIELEKNDP